MDETLEGRLRDAERELARVRAVERQVRPMKPEDMTREQLEEVARCAGRLIVVTKPDKHRELCALRDALNPSPLPSCRALVTVAEGSPGPTDNPNAPDTGPARTAYRNVYAHALRLAADHISSTRLDAFEDYRDLFRAWADEMEGR